MVWGRSSPRTLTSVISYPALHMVVSQVLLSCLIAPIRVTLSASASHKPSIMLVYQDSKPL